MTVPNPTLHAGPLRRLTVREAAALLSVSPRTIQRAYRARRLRAMNVGRLYRIAPSDLERWQREGGLTS